MKISPIIYIPLLHVALLAIFSGYYLPLLFSNEYPKYLTLLIVNPIIVFISYKTIKQKNIDLPKEDNTKTTYFWIFLAITSGIIHYFGLFFPTILSGYLHFGSIQELQNQLIPLTNLKSISYFPGMPITWGILFYLTYLLYGAITEEYIYRKFLFSYCLKRSMLFALIVSSIIFNLIHVQRDFIPYHLNTALTFAILYYLSGKLWVAIIAHFSFNAMGILGFFLLNSGWWTFFIWIYPLCYILGYAFTTYYFAKLLSINNKFRLLIAGAYLLLSLVLTFAGFIGISGINIFVI